MDGRAFEMVEWTALALENNPTIFSLLSFIYILSLSCFVFQFPSLPLDYIHRMTRNVGRKTRGTISAEKGST